MEGPSLDMMEVERHARLEKRRIQHVNEIIVATRKTIKGVNNYGLQAQG
jgi:hypothetical protein